MSEIMRNPRDMSNKRNQLKMTKLRHSSLDLADPQIKKKQSDVLSKARHKLFDAWKHKKPDESKALPKSMTQCTLDYFAKDSQGKDQQAPGPKPHLQKQTSVGSYPEIQISFFDSDLDDEDDVFYSISRFRPATVCVDRPSVDRRSDAEALALERPRKKLSFKEPEVDIKDKQPNRTIPNNHADGHGRLHNTLKSCERILRHPKLSVGKSAANGPSNADFTLGKGLQSIAGLGLSVVTNGVHRAPSFEDAHLESQAMRVVRTVGQAFEVCHKLSIGAPEDNFDDEQDTTLTQDLLSDRLSDVASDKPKKDITSEGGNSDKNSLPPDESSLKDSYLENSIKHSKPPAHLDILPPPPSNSNNSRKSPLQAETYASPHSDGLGSNSNPGNASNTLPPPGGALSSHHEIQLLREQMEQQRQQTQAAVAQLQLAREQLQAEQTARMEAQARTHQLLVHNRELLDHIAALVAHLQGGDKPGQQSSPPHMTMPQPSQDTQQQPPQLDPNLVLQALGLSPVSPPGVFENRTANTCQSPLRSTFNPAGAGGIFNFTYPAPGPLQVDTSLETQLLQRIQALGAYPQLSPPYQYGFPPQMMNQGLYGFPQYGYATLPRTLTNIENRLNMSRHSEPRQIFQTYSGQDTGQKDLSQYKEEPLYQKPSFANPNQTGSQLSVPTMPRRHSTINLTQETQPNRRLQIPRASSPKPQNPTATIEPPNETQFIKPLSQVGTLTTTDSEGRVRVIVPVPSNSEEGDLLSNLRISDELRLMNGPGISRSASERVPNRSELMSQVQRTMWARHTTK